MAVKATCGAHDLLTENVIHLRDSIGQLYDLNRLTQADLSEIKADYAGIKADLDGLRNSSTMLTVTFNQLLSEIGSMREENERHSESIVRQVQKMTPKRWTPQHTVALVSALFGAGGGVTALIMMMAGG
jgi:hypothetical protein